MLKEQGITPAYAGNTTLTALKPFIWQDHPRLRGEYYWLRTQHEKNAESPTLARGVLFSIWENQLTVRITPACAGSTDKIEEKKSESRDHPRLRGEYASNTWIRVPVWGSHPLTRGIHQCLRRLEMTRLITPAYTGNTLFDSICNLTHMDHPRLRGEYMIVENILPLTIGSPLLARGVRFW